MPDYQTLVDSWVADVEFERLSAAKRALKAIIVNPAANYLPAPMLRGILRLSRSELAAANWSDPGGWRSMVISYKGNCPQISDKVLVGAGTMPMALRNRRKLGARILARLIDRCPNPPAHVLCLGAGPGHIITDALCQAKANATATLVDISSDAFEYGTRLAQERGLADRVRFVKSDVRDIAPLLERPPSIVKMLGICEYLTDEQISEIVGAVASVTPRGASIVFNCLSPAHGTDRFFRRVFGLNMIYRNQAQLQALLAPRGWGDFAAVAEPLGVYQVVVAHRT
jgi:hypothetical protein